MNAMRSNKIFFGIVGGGPNSWIGHVHRIAARFDNRYTLCAGVFSRIFIHETMGVSLGMGEDMTPENIEANWDKISDMTDARALQNGGEQTLKFFELINK